MTQSHRLIVLAEELRQSAQDVLDLKNRKLSAAVMLKAAAELERVAPLDPEPQVVVGEN